jgi:hypothetical protein
MDREKESDEKAPLSKEILAHEIEFRRDVQEKMKICLQRGDFVETGQWCIYTDHSIARFKTHPTVESVVFQDKVFDEGKDGGGWIYLKPYQPLFVLRLCKYGMGFSVVWCMVCVAMIVVSSF